MGVLAWFVFAAALPTLIGCAVIVLARAMVRCVHWRRRGTAQPRPIEQLGAQLRRLHADLDATEAELRTPGKRVRTRASRAAYVDLLREACVRLEVPPPAAEAAGHARLTDIYRAEAALRARGLDVRAPAE
jgi:hypothetical protein